MFDMGLTEMMLIGIVALVVVGPDKLPGVARTAGKYFGKLKRFVSSVKSDVESELRADELREILSKQQKELDSLKNVMKGTSQAVADEFKSKPDKSQAESLQPSTDNLATAESDQKAEQK